MTATFSKMCDRDGELNRIYPSGILRVHGNYSTFLERKEEFLPRSVEETGSARKPVIRRLNGCVAEPKPGQKKSKARIDKAMSYRRPCGLERKNPESAPLKSTSRPPAQDETLIEWENVAYPDRRSYAVRDVNFNPYCGDGGWGWSDRNGSGKTTLLRSCAEDLSPTGGEMRRLSGYELSTSTRVPNLTRNVTLAPRSGSGRRFGNLSRMGVHVASWAARFLFTGRAAQSTRRTLSEASELAC